MALDRAQVLREYACAAREHNTYPSFKALPADPEQRLDGWLEGASITPVSATEWDCFEAWVLGPRVINDSMWFFFLHGTGWGQVEGLGGKFTIGPGDLMLIPQGARHTVRQDPGVQMKLIAVHFHPHIFSGINLLNLAGFPPHAPGSAAAPYEAVSRQLTQEFAIKAPGWRQVFRAGVMEVLMHLTRVHGDRFGGLTHAPAKGQLPRVLPALEMIERRLTDPGLNVVDLAAKLFVSEVQFRKLFRRATGLAPIRFIQRRRIEHACTLLRGTGDSIEQVAGACGFVDTPFFYRVFKTWTGTTPAQYRSLGGV